MTEKSQSKNTPPKTKYAPWLATKMGGPYRPFQTKEEWETWLAEENPFRVVIWKLVGGEYFQYHSHPGI